MGANNLKIVAKSFTCRNYFQVKLIWLNQTQAGCFTGLVYILKWFRIPQRKTKHLIAPSFKETIILQQQYNANVSTSVVLGF